MHEERPEDQEWERETGWEAVAVIQEQAIVANFLCIEPNDKYFQRCRPYRLCCNYSICPWVQK